MAICFKVGGPDFQASLFGSPRAVFRSDSRTFLNASTEIPHLTGMKLTQKIKMSHLPHEALCHYMYMYESFFWGGWSGGAKVLCILDHRGVQLILAYSWARPAILVVGKGRGGMFLFLLFLHFHSCSSFFPVPLFHLLYSLFYLFSPFLWETTQNDPQGLTCR